MFFDWRFVLIFLLVANASDYFSTWLFVSTQGVDAEGNKFMRWLMRAGWGWFTLYKLAFLSSVSAAVIAMVSRRTTILNVPLLALGIIFLLTSIHNVFAYFLFSP